MVPKCIRKILAIGHHFSNQYCVFVFVTGCTAAEQPEFHLAHIRDFVDGPGRDSYRIAGANLTSLAINDHAARTREYKVDFLGIRMIVSLRG
jgi:hypothetical protein